MFLAILLIFVSLLVFYNEIDSKMNITEYILLFISLIVIIGASVNYIKINKINEGFTSNIKNVNYNNNKNEYYTNVKEKDIILNSEDSEEYLDPDKKPILKNSFINSKDNAYMENQKNPRHINKVNELLGISSNFVDIPVPTYMPTISTMDNYMPTTMDTTMDTTIDTTMDTTMYTTMDTTMDTTMNTTISTTMPTEYETEDYKNEINENEIRSIFNPKVIIGKGKGKKNSNNNDNGFGSNGYSSRWNSVFKNDGFGFDDTMNPVNNLWYDNHSYYDTRENSNTNCKNTRGSNTSNTSNIKTGISSDEWTQNMDSYNKGKWQRNQYNRPSDYVDYIYPSGYGTSTPDSFLNTMNQNTNQDIDQDIYGNTSSNSINNSNPQITLYSNIKTSKECAPNLDLDENQAGDLIVKDYKQSKKWIAGYTYVPPVHWDVPQKRTPVCNLANPNIHKLTGLIDKGLPINALELTENGYIADTEDTVKLSNVGSMIPKFNYQEQPFSKPYV